MQQVAGMALQQTLSPQMQQSLNILQAPLTELRQLVDTELRANPALEEIVPDKSDPLDNQVTSKLDDQWDEYYAQRSTAEPWTQDALERRQHFLDSQVRPPPSQSIYWSNSAPPLGRGRMPRSLWNSSETWMPEDTCAPA